MLLHAQQNGFHPRTIANVLAPTRECVLVDQEVRNFSVKIDRVHQPEATVVDTQIVSKGNASDYEVGQTISFEFLKIVEQSAIFIGKGGDNWLRLLCPINMVQGDQRVNVKQTNQRVRLERNS